MILDDKPELVIGIPIDTVNESGTLHYVAQMGKAISRLQSGVSLQQIGNADISIVEKGPEAFLQ